MANYYKQCSCRGYADVVPCYDCLEKENKRLRDQNRKFKEAAKDFVNKVESGRARSRDSYRKFKEALEGGGER